MSTEDIANRLEGLHPRWQVWFAEDDKQFWAAWRGHFPVARARHGHPVALCAPRAGELRLKLAYEDNCVECESGPIPLPVRNAGPESEHRISIRVYAA